MNNYKYFSLIFCALFAVTTAFGQIEALHNGRDANAVAGPIEVEQINTNINPNQPQTNDDAFSDADIPGEQQVVQEDTYYPEDFDFMREELQATTSPAEVAQKINELNTLINDLRGIAEELRLENKIIRESLNNCCSSSSLGLSANDAYLLQNAPNPFNATSVISYFIPRGLENVEINLTTIKGEVLRTLPIEEAGYGKISVEAETLSTGTFIYTLSVKGQVIDSKVMVIAE